MDYLVKTSRVLVFRFAFWVLVAWLPGLMSLGCGSDKPVNSGGNTHIMPLAVGNEWVFRVTDYRGSNQGGEVDYDTIVVTEGKVIQGERWYYRQRKGNIDPESPLYTNRADGLWMNDLGDEWLQFKYPAHVGDTYQWGGPLTDTFMIEVEAIHAGVNVPAGEFQAYTYVFNGGSSSGVSTVDVVPGIGEVRWRLWSSPDRLELLWTEELMKYSFSQ